MWKWLKKFFHGSPVDAMNSDEIYNEWQRIYRSTWNIQEQYTLRKEFREGTDDGTR